MNEVLDNVVIPRDYPEVSTKSVDKTIQGSLTFVETCATLTIHPVQGWSVEPDKELVLNVILYAVLKIMFCVFVRSPIVKLIDLRWQSTKQRISTTTLLG